MKKYLFIPVCWIFGTAIAQTSSQKTLTQYSNQKDIMQSIEAKSKNIPFQIPDYNSVVSLNESGDGVINIPVVTAKGRGLTLPINLNYVASGIRIDQPSSEVGLGWSINFGSIRRDFGSYEPDYSFCGSEFEMPYLSGQTSNENRQLAAYNLGTVFHDPYGQNRVLSYDNVNSGSYAPDLYTVNVPGGIDNSFWNTNLQANTWSPNFMFTEDDRSKISYTNSTLTD